MTALFHNFDTNADYDLNGKKLTDFDDDFIVQFIPKIFDDGRHGGAVRCLYRCLRNMGKSKIDAYVETMYAVVGRNPDGSVK